MVDNAKRRAGKIGGGAQSRNFAARAPRADRSRSGFGALGWQGALGLPHKGTFKEEFGIDVEVLCAR